MPEKQTLAVQLIVRNEEHRYLRQILESIKEYASPTVNLKIIILDDCSTDETPKLCESFPDVILKRRHGKPLWSVDESKLRTELWEMVRKLKPDFCLTQDADELFDKSFKKRLPELLNSNYDWHAFRLCDMWGSVNHYRIDGHWSPTFRRLFRFKDESFGLTGKIHCGPIPRYASESNNGICHMDIRIKHFSWMTEKDRKQKMELYSKIPMQGLNKEHLESVSSPPRLKKWSEEIQYPKIKICTLFKNDEWCTDEFLEKLVSQKYPKNRLSFLFLENDSKDRTLEKLQNWQEKWKKKYRKIEVISKKFGLASQEHVWTDPVLANVTLMRNSFLKQIEDNDYIFNVDSDVMLDSPQVLKHLALSDRDIIAEIFWARWDRIDNQLMPNVWAFGGYEGVGEDFTALLKRKGIYTVGGLGACNLISKNAIEKGCSFDPVSNLPLYMRGEDRHFCIRATVLGFLLWVDTFFPVRHLEKLDYDLRLKLKETRKKRLPENHMSLVMIVNNEEYLLENFLYRMSELFNEIIIVDTGSKDNSKRVAQRYTNKIYDFKWCDDYSKIRNFAINKATCPWIFYADPDENYKVKQLGQFETMVRTENAIGFIFLVFNYRGDRSKPTLSESLRLFRNFPELKFTGLVHETLDEAIAKYMKKNPGKIVGLSPIPMFHWGFVKGSKERAEKLNYYRKLDEKQLRENPKDCRPYYNLAVHLLEEKGKKLEGVALLQKAMELSPTFYQPRRELGLYYLREAQAQFAAGLKILPPGHPFHDFQKRAVQWIGNFLGEGQIPQKIRVQPGARVR